MNRLSYCLALYQTWEIPRLGELLLRCLRFPELCPVTVRLPEIFASRRQAALLIPSALPFADLLCPSSTSYELEGLGLVATLVNIKLHFLSKIKCKHFTIVFVNKILLWFSAFFHNFSVYISHSLCVCASISNTILSIFADSVVIYPKNL